MRRTWQWLRNLWELVRSGMLLGYYRLARLWLASNDPWAHVVHPVPFRYFGLGSRREFNWYLEGNSVVGVASIHEIKRWLLGCVYKTDRALFDDPDFCQHPEMFEGLRQGDCEDHAIWAWRKLKELGVPARLYSGRVLMPVTGGAGFHAWVVFEHEGRSWLFESVAFHATRSSGCCSVISASHSRCTPPMSATQCRWVSSSCLTDSTPAMKRGNSSNWVHWS